MLDKEERKKKKEAKETVCVAVKEMKHAGGFQEMSYIYKKDAIFSFVKIIVIALFITVAIFFIDYSNYIFTDRSLCRLEECTVVSIRHSRSGRNTFYYSRFADESGNEFELHTAFKDSVGRKVQVYVFPGAENHSCRKNFELVKDSAVILIILFVIDIALILSFLYYIIKYISYIKAKS